MQESKEKIKARMMKNASRFWGFQEMEDENSFDPLVGMLVGALSGELEKISHEIHSSESRVLERLVELLTPDPITGPSPAHSVAHADPSEPVFAISPFHEFYLNKKFYQAGSQSAEEKQVFFTPAGSYKLFKGQARFLASGSRLFEFQEDLLKEIHMSAVPGKSLPRNEIWIGLDLDPDIESLEGLSLFFNLKNEVYEDSFCHSLSKGKWSVNGKPAQVERGTGINSDSNGFDVEKLLNHELDVTAKICGQVNRFYSRNFITFSGTLMQDFRGKGNWPSAFSDIFNHRDLDKLPSGIVWVKVEFPQILPPEVLDNLFCSINCFPVVNRRMNEFTQSVKGLSNIIPLQADEVFLDMAKVAGNSGKTYSSQLFTGADTLSGGFYIVRHGGVGRFDSRDAAGLLSYLLELVRDESAAFSVLGTDLIYSNLKEMSQTIARLEQRLKDSNILKENIAYLLLKAFPDDNILFVGFWTTGGTFANKIKSGTKLRLYQGSDIAHEGIFLVTPTVGGCEQMDTENRINAYRRSLLSHGRIVTAEDIKALCYEHFGKLLQKVEVRKGIEAGKSSNEGFIRTIDIFLHLVKNHSASADEVVFMNQELLIKLEEQSANILPYRIFIAGD